ncbi:MULTISPECIES: hypothetical protein [Streptomyces]|jgi:hypothetical protein|uniref:Secreted protein n=1 Tax=Streptomyces luteogriseus TaxID=68233 RepID=A0A7W7DVG7_9ACTN|nr:MULTISPECIES: hypothetical protein [Streptomyces]MBB4717416.1 hypothetical protein [Streptomyces luteogriseus]MCX3292470.1 hypothetical protein [Streptomyces sp. NEAU-H22]WMD06035.1 hypothetical protein Q7C01_17195 [Streptomyces sp. FXY-T5]
MISTRRIVAAVGLAAGVTGLVAPMANAADAEAKSPLSPMSTLDSLAVSDIPAEHKAEIPRPSSQVAGLKRLNDLDQLNQVVGLVSPVFGFLPNVR